MSNAERAAPQSSDNGYAAFEAWRLEAERLDPRSHVGREHATALAALLAESGVISGPSSASVVLPPGFAAVSPMPEKVEVPAGQFNRTVQPLSGNELYAVDGTELSADDGHRIRVVDLRPLLDVHLHDIQPSPADANRLERHWYHDLRFFLTTGHPRQAVHCLRGAAHVFYTSVMGTKSRAYWMPVRIVNGNSMPTVARLGECGNDTKHEAAFYRRLFGRRLHHVAEY